jgi:hypothetical protein
VNKLACAGDLKRCILRSRRRTCRCDFSARLFLHLELLAKKRFLSLGGQALVEHSSESELRTSSTMRTSRLNREARERPHILGPATVAGKW